MGSKGLLPRKIMKNINDYHDYSHRAKCSRKDLLQQRHLVNVVSVDITLNLSVRCRHVFRASLAIRQQYIDLVLAAKMDEKAGELCPKIHCPYILHSFIFSFLKKSPC